MNNITDILRDHVIIRNNPSRKKFKWQYPIKSQLPKTYSFRSGQSLLEFTYRVSVHNSQVWNNDPNPVSLKAPNFNVRIEVNTTVIGQEVNVLNFYYSKKLNIIVLAFTATYNNQLWLVDIDYPQTAPREIGNYIDGMKMHRGFWNFYHGIQEHLHDLLNTYVKKHTQVLVCGLSLGGATSTVCALDLFKRKLASGRRIRNLVHYSFESPRVLNTVGADHYDSLKIPSYRIANNSDIVTDLPFAVMPISLIPFVTEDFTHVRSILYYNKNLGGIYDNHVTACINEYCVKDLNPSS